ncbi:MAG: DUF305 domain-containing protein [Gammaproteobacteria bacterium]|nr:MAG: DUF305 domain-containing protein [Gammaproteobacteria bacterium]
MGRKASYFNAPARHGLIALLVLFAGSAVAQAPIVQPGAPGMPSRLISAEEAVQLAGLRHSAADVRFMQDMIPHHQQALDMSVLAPERGGSSELIELARRIETTQIDEIEFMERWLTERGEALPDRDWRHHLHGHHEHAHHGDHHDHGDHAADAEPAHGMEGMATAEQMAELAAASGQAFDTLYLELMIEHHKGALKMVEELLDHSGSASDPELYEFVTEVKNDQDAEIERMTLMLAGYSPDPRVGLAAGFRDAGEAIWNLELLAALPKPDGFFDPENPAALPASRLRELANGEGATARATRREDPEDDDADPDAARGDEAAAEDAAEDEPEERIALLDFANTDMAFAGDLLVVGNYHGFKLYHLGEDGLPELKSAVVCPGGQGDVSVVGDLLILSVEQQRGRVDCGLKGVAGKVNEERFRGLRIFDISDTAMPVQVGQVQTCRGSHTHTVVAGPGEDGRIIVYNSGTAPVREEEEMEGCIDESPWRDEGTALFRIDVIEIPVDRPEESRIVHSPAVFADPETGILAGLWERGDHGRGTQTSAETNHCHDITVFPELNLAAGACSGNGILFDISDPLNPERIDAVVDPGFAYWHSATFNNDGTRVIFTDEWGGGVRPRCRASDPRTWGANAIFDIVDGKLVHRSYYKLPAPQTKEENCVAHNGSLLPVPGRDIMVQAWYQGGISVFDFTDAAAPFEIAYFDRGPIDEKALVTAGYWSAYWHRGFIYGTEIVRGLDVLALLPSEYLSEHEIAAANLVEVQEEFNPQQQFRVSWPAEPVVARAYRDQLQRDGQLDEDALNRLDAAMDAVQARLDAGGRDRRLASELRNLARDSEAAAREQEGRARQRLQALAGVLEEIAGRLRG